MDEKKQTLGWEVVNEIRFNQNCSPVKDTPPNHSVEECTHGEYRFEISFRGQHHPLIADQVSLTSDGAIHFSDRSFSMKNGHGPIQTVSQIARRRVCSTQHAANGGLEVPSGWCVEPVQFAANFSYDTPLANRILTRGFSFYFETVPPRNIDQKDMTDHIRVAFATALTSWTSVLWKNRKRYGAPLQTFLDGLTLRSSSNYIMLVPPQVIALGCPNAASFVVRAVLDQSPPFVGAYSTKAAFAQKPGRTIILNFSRYKCWENAYFRFVFNESTRCVNLVPILAHELGHAFGLDHASPFSDSIMSEVIGRTEPSDTDADRLANVLLQSIVGGRPGQFDFSPDNGASVEFRGQDRR